MNAKEIRLANELCQKKCLETKTQGEHQAGLDSLKASMLTEVAAQLAEANEKMGCILNPPLLWERTKIDPAALRDDALQNLPQGILTVMEPRLTLRDQFAMAALQGMLASVDPEASVAVSHNTTKEAYLWADAMLEARKAAL